MIDKRQIETSQRRMLIDITQQIRDHVRKSEIKEGICVLYVPHTTCGITINESTDPDVRRDILFALDRAVPNMGFHHFEGNSDAHMQSAMLGCSQTLMIENGQLVLGRWQSIFFVELDGPRMRHFYVKCMAG